MKFYALITLVFLFATSLWAVQKNHYIADPNVRSRAERIEGSEGKATRAQAGVQQEEAIVDPDATGVQFVDKQGARASSGNCPCPEGTTKNSRK